MPLLVFEHGMFTGRNDKVSQMQQHFHLCEPVFCHHTTIALQPCP